MLKIDHLRKNYGSFALDCSLEVQPGCITGLIGQNGAGKSTTFKAVLGLISTDGGSIRIFGKDLKDFAKMGWKLVIITLFVITGTFVFSALVADVILKLTGAI